MEAEPSFFRSLYRNPLLIALVAIGGMGLYWSTNEWKVFFFFTIMTIWLSFLAYALLCDLYGKQEAREFILQGTQESISSETPIPLLIDDSETQRGKFRVILLNDDAHTYEYVIRMLREVFGYSTQQAFRLADRVDKTGRAIVEVTTWEQAQQRVQQIKAYGPDRLSWESKSSMEVEIEAIE